jgi:hypothetical protein
VVAELIEACFAIVETQTAGISEMVWNIRAEDFECAFDPRTGCDSGLCATT